MLTLIFAPMVFILTAIAYFMRIDAPRILWLIIAALALLDFFSKLLEMFVQPGI